MLRGETFKVRDGATLALIRETGSIRVKARWEVQITAREFLEAAVIRSRPLGVLTNTLEAGFQSISRASRSESSA